MRPSFSIFAMLPDVQPLWIESFENLDGKVAEHRCSRNNLRRKPAFPAHRIGILVPQPLSDGYSPSRAFFTNRTGKSASALHRLTDCRQLALLKTCQEKR
jgi:hypothetical protein